MRENPCTTSKGKQGAFAADQSVSSKEPRRRRGEPGVMSFSDDDFGDDDEDFVALTLRPPNAAVLAQLTQPTQPTQHSADSQHRRTELLQAKGEIAVLRAKLEELERGRRAERETLQSENHRAKAQNESKTQALEAMIKRLEDEKKFLSVEVRNLNAHKRRKRTSNEHFRPVEQNDSDTATPQPVTPMPQAQVRASAPVITATIPPPRTATVKIIAPRQADDNAQLIDTIMNHIIPGCQSTTMHYLSKISLDEEFQSDILTIPPNEPLSTHILQFLVSQRESHRLDEFVTKITKLITYLIRKLFLSPLQPHKFPIPYLLALIHCTVTFRPKAVIKEVLDELIHLCFDLMQLHEHLLRKDEELGDYYQRHKRLGVSAIQYEFTSHLLLVYSCDLMESLIVTASEDTALVKSLLNELNQGNELGKFLKLTFSVHSKLLVMAPLIEILSTSLNCYDGEESFPFFTQGMASLMVQLLLEGLEWSPNWLFNGLNRLMGNTVDSVHITNLVGDKVKSYPQVIYPKEVENKARVENFHQQQLIIFQLNILSFFEKLIITTNTGITNFNTDPLILKSLIFSIGKQQELIFNSPRDNLTHMRSKLLSSLVRVLHLIWEMTTMDTGTSSPSLTKDTTHELLIVLSRMAFNNSETSNQATEFLIEVREKDMKTTVFNKWAEERANQIAHVDDSSDMMSAVRAQMGYSNGLEFAYDDDVVELARDILEKCTTMDEADALFIAMNSADDRKGDDDEMMLGV